MMAFYFWVNVVVLFWIGCSRCGSSDGRRTGTYVIDEGMSMGRRFDGIGAISGGGATSKLLTNYPAKEQNEILDFLFKPDFGASLHLLKVEIGGDSQSTEGTESSHMHSRDDLNFQRGYEWWMMKEAKKRNPDILLYGLPWVWPGWLGSANHTDPYANITDTVSYVIAWIRGAQQVHNLTIDYIGIWNERPYNVDYIKLLRTTLDTSGFTHVRIVAADGEWAILDDLNNDTQLQKAVDIIGIHYPGARTPAAGYILGKTLWSSEDYSVVADLSGGACWARILAESYVDGYFTGIIAWNLVSSYYVGLPHSRHSLMTANQPWSGHYQVDSPIWITAHFTQFSWPGWVYYSHYLGVGNLTANGTYISLASPDFTQLTIIIVTMDPAFAHCNYPMPKYTVEPQTAQFAIKGRFANISELNVWYSRFSTNDSETVLFKKKDAIPVVDGRFLLDLDVNEIYTLTTLHTGTKGAYGDPPAPASFPTNYQDDFNSYPENTEPYNLVAQAGVFEVVRLPSGGALAQVVPAPPIDTCRPQQMPRPVAVLGDFSWSDVSVAIDFMIPVNSSDGIFIASRVNHGGCWTMYANGTFLWAFPGRKELVLTANATGSYIYGTYPAQLEFSKWHTLRLDVQGDDAAGFLDGELIFRETISRTFSSSGFAAIGVDSFSKVYFDNIKLRNATVGRTEKVPVLAGDRGYNSVAK